MTHRALEHLEDAEVALISFMVRTEEVPDDAPDDEFPAVMSVLSAVLRSVSRAAGILEGDKHE